MDLSRRRDSVETRKTPSPYSSSNFGGSSPSLIHDSPSTTASRIVKATLSNKNRHRSDTPTHHYQSSIPQSYCQTPPSYHPNMFYQYPVKRESPSPPEEDIRAHHMHRNHLDYTTKSPLINRSPEDLNPYLLHAVALQQKIAAQSHQIMPRADSDESSESISNSILLSPTSATPQSPSSTYPMVMGRDGKLSRPFKAYPRDPLTISASFSATDAMLDCGSTQKFHMFRKQMLDQIHAANGGQATVSNPKMRRTSSKTFAESADQQQQQQHQQHQKHLVMQQQEQQNNQSDSSSNGGNNGSGQKDTAYFERRKKNNAAAKKSRDRRRIKEDEIAIRAAFLERENIELKIELTAVKRQLSTYMVS